MQRFVCFVLGALRDKLRPISLLGLSVYQLDAAQDPASTETVNKRAAVHRFINQLGQSNGPQEPECSKGEQR
ncbi:hypothetical protein BA177_15045 [Woeseia oceani]|uniref:Uncharacterized protein n=1 Tax=Woeseia oceani TaxID=1548547 RepID=A0A193LIJ7_9GAMM|nr:hypothetical protein BA177_15045 [Woeseia oceani]